MAESSIKHLSDCSCKGLPRDAAEPDSRGYVQSDSLNSIDVPPLDVPDYYKHSIPANMLSIYDHFGIEFVKVMKNPARTEKQILYYIYLPRLASVVKSLELTY